MTTRHRSRFAQLAVIASIAVMATTAVTVPAALGASHSPWTVISSGNVGNTVETPSIAKFGSGYEAVWTAQLGSSKYELQARNLNAAGKPVGGVINVLGKTWSLVGEDPTIFGIGKTRYIAFTGDAGGTGTLTLGMEDYASSTNGGKTWKVSTTDSLSHTELAGQDTGTSVIPNGGTPITAMTLSKGVTYHVGFGGGRPATSADKNAGSTLFPSDPGVAVDSKNHEVWVLWASGDGGSHDDGVWAQRVSPSAGKQIHAPGSFAAGGTTSYGPEQDLSAAARAGGGVYTAYVTAARSSIDVWKVGASKPFATIKDLQGPSNVVVTAGPGGRIWLYWRDDVAWHAARSNKAATRFGPTTTVGTPKNDISNLEIAGAGSGGPLEAIALLTTAKNVNQVVAHQFLPRLSVRVSPKTVKRGHSFTVTVTDAGDPVKGATVHFGGAKKKTNAKGRAVFKVKGATSLGKHPVTFTLHGYAAARALVKVT